MDRPMSQWRVCALFMVTSIWLTDSVAEFLDAQPKLISESGNLIIESALDKNITIRLRGHGIFMLNDRNLMDMSEPSRGRESGGYRVLDRVLRLQTSTRELESRFEGIPARILRLENQSQSAPNNVSMRLRNLTRRLSRLERTLSAFQTRFDTDHCASNPCQNGGSCRNELGTFRCACPDNFEGTTCTDDRNECADFAGTDLGCQNGATCENTYGSYRCACAFGWSGVSCKRRSVDCLAGPPGELCGHGACVQTNDARGFTCVCQQGWKTDGVTPACTVDVDECADARPHCSMDPPVRCVNLPGTYTCGQCPAGFEGNGHYCRDVDECAVDNGGCSTVPMVRCVNERGSHRCSACPAGWQGDGRLCTRSTFPPASNGGGTGGTDSTVVCPPGLCHPLATCRANPHALFMVSCDCPSGMVGFGIGPRGCRPNPNAEPCAARPCLNGGTCTANGTTGFQCQCAVGFAPPFCLPDMQHPCVVNPCQNGGTCLLTTSLRQSLSDARYTCRCPLTHTGDTCGQELRTCGGVLSSRSGVLRYPVTTSAQYGPNQRCAWLIQTNVTQVLNVTFRAFNVEASSECRRDWLQIHDGASSSAYMIGRFCGGSLPKGGNVVSTHNSMYLWFRSDNSTTSEGFELEWNTIDPVCGGLTLVTTYGTITSPGSPGNYPQNRDCEWRLQTAPGKRIELHFFAMQLESHDSCDMDFVAVYDGASTDGTLLARYCNTTRPEPLTSSGTELLVHFHSDGIGTDTGFQLHYSQVEGVPGCGGTWTDNRGEITSPKQNGQYSANLRCAYLIRVPQPFRIRLTFVEFDLERSPHCFSDWLDIYEGASADDPLVGRFCGDNIPASFVSASNVLRIELRTDYSVHADGFRLQYQTVCDQRFTNETGTITSPMYPARYDRSTNCRYEIVAPPGKAIVLDFIDFDVEDTGQCSYDWVSLNDGLVGNETDRGRRFCGIDKPPQTISQLNVLVLELHTDGSIQRGGFKANYSMIDAARCGGVIRTLGHVIRPPVSEATNHYKRNEHCIWLIQAPPDHVVELTFSSFELESGSCGYDFLEVQDLMGASKTTIGRYCGDDIPPVQRTSSNVMGIEFRTDTSIQHDGFMASYEFLSEQNFCGGRRFASPGTLTSPGWPKSYGQHLDCSWTIVAPQHQQIEITVVLFELERVYHTDSTHIDHLEIRDGGSDTSPLIGRYYYNRIPKTIRSLTNRLYIKFHTDNSVSAPGFKFDWDFTLTGCGGQISGNTVGSITSPNYPQPYAENTACEWRISVSHGSKIQITFTDLDLEDGYAACYFDGVEVYDGRSSAAKKLGRFCGDTVPTALNTTSNEVLIRLDADSSNQGRGFELHYETSCDQRLTDLHGIIQSPGNPQTYPPNMHCQWTIVAPRGNRIRLDFSEFQLETSQQCSYDRLEIEQLNNDAVAENRKYCREMPAPITTFTDTVTLRFISDNSYGASGFRVEYTVIGCVELMRTASGVLHSPNYPAAYPGNMECLWRIEVPHGNLVELRLHDYDFPDTKNCTKDGVRITADMDMFNNVCGQREVLHPPPVFTSHTNVMEVRFYSSGEHAGRGFNATYRTVSEKCGGTMSTYRGSIKSPNYPMNYDNNMYCEWLISAPDLHKVQLSFADFSLEKIHDDCGHDSVTIYSGRLVDDQKKLATLCGHDATPANIYNSTSSEMLVVLSTDFSDQLKGFLANFWTECGTTIEVTADGGHLTSDMIYRYESLECNYTFRAPSSDDHVVLTFLELYNTHQDCNTSISVQDTSTMVLCQIDHHPHPFVSTSNSISMKVARTKLTTSDTFRFRMQYSLVSAGCGQELAAKRGDIASPGYPSTYPLNSECIWTVAASRGNRMQLTFRQAFDIDSTAESEHCNEAYLEVRESDAQGALLGAFCGSQIAAPLVANSFWMKFHSGEAATGHGFLASYAYVSMVQLSGEMGEIQSPLYPAYDIRTENQQYRILAPLGTVIVVRIQHFINRAGATLKFHDGYDDQSIEIASFSTEPGTQTTPVVSTTNAMMIVWNVPTEALFRLTWSAHSVDTVATVLANGTTVHNETLNCTANSLVRIGFNEQVNITSPGYPFGYDTNLDCQWTLAPVLDGYHVALYFTNIDLEDTVNCASDAVSAAPGTDLAGPWTAEQRFCTAQSNASIHTKIHGSPMLRLTFKTDYWANRTGFAAVAAVQCGGPLSGPSGSITHDMTLSVMIGLTCDWTIAVREGRTVRVTIRRLQLSRDPHTQNCDSFLMLRNGHSLTASPYLGAGQYCGIALPDVTVLESSGNVATVQFSKGSLTNRDQFRVDYEEASIECGGTYRLNDRTSAGANDTGTWQYVHTPNYPNIPHAFSECVWTVVAPHGQLLAIDFEGNFELSDGQPCVQELVELRDGTSEMAPVIGTFCGRKPSTQRTTGNVVRIRYFTQAKMPKNGFRARVSVDKCGGSYHDASGTVTSPGYPGLGAYPLGSVCDYRIFSRPGATLNITFSDFDLGESSDYDDDSSCGTVDRVEIYDVIPASGSDPNESNNGTTSLIGHYCTSDMPRVIVTQANQVLVRMVSTAQRQQLRGFKLFYNTSVDRCGGDISAESGYILSPGYPVGQNQRQFCEWRITVPKGRRVRVDMMDLDIGGSGEPTSSSARPHFAWRYRSTRLNFYNDLFYTNPVVIISDDALTDAPVYSTDNQMLINFRSISNANHRGFKLNFTSNEATVCTGDFNELAGRIQSPANLTRFSCTYQRDRAAPFFAAEPGVGTLAMRISIVEPPINAVPCNPSVGLVLPLRVYNEDNLIFVPKRRCNNGSATIVDTVATPFASVVVRTRQSVAMQSYTVDHRVYQCGGVISDRTAYTVIAPALSDTVIEGEPLSCTWYFSGLTGMRLVVQMDWSGLDCEHDHVNVFNGRYPSSPLVERVCGTDAGRRNFTADISGEHLLVEFHTTRYRSNGTVFLVQIDTNYALCGGLLTSPNYQFQSPRNGSSVTRQYANNLECVWELRARRGYHVGVSFRNRFFVEQSANCTKDVVQLDEVKSNGDVRMLARLCGRSVPDMVNTTGGTMRVTMRTDGQISADGFEALWSENCGGTFEVVAGAETADIFSPNYPENYGRNEFCNYTLIGPAEEYISVEFVDFELEDSSLGCVHDNLTVYRMPDWSWMGTTTQLVGAYCSKGALRMMRYRNRIELIFRSDYSVQKKGFHFRYRIDSCGGIINSTTTRIRLPATADETEYLPNLQCVWNITAPVDKKIVVRFERIELEPSDYCALDFVELYEGYDVDQTKRKAQLCGNLTGHAPVVNLNDHRALIRFQSDASNSKGVLEALVMFVSKCDATIELTEAVPTFELAKVFAEYAPSLDCHYKVTAPDGWTIRMTFVEFHLAECALTANRGCHCDYVQVRDGAGEFAEPIGENLCGHTLPAAVTSTHGAMWVRFVTDTEISSTGFKARFTMERTVCGATQITLNETHSQETLSWPRNGGSELLPNERCQWRFSSSDGSLIVLSFDRLDIPNRSVKDQCDNYLEVLDSENLVYLPEGLQSSTMFIGGKTSLYQPTFYNNRFFASASHKYCGTTDPGALLPDDFVSAKNELLVRFRSDDTFKRGGFAVTAKILKACHRNYTSLAGRIVSNTLATCDTYVTVPANYTIALYFARFAMQPIDYTFKCTEANAPLKIMDGSRMVRWECPMTLSMPFFSNSSSVTLRFTDINAVSYTTSMYDITYVASNQGRGCGGDIANYGGQISSPLYPATGRMQRSCRWTLTVPQNQVVQLQFEVFDMGPSSTCADNFVQLIEPGSAMGANNGTERVVRTFCGTERPANFASQSNRVDVLFQSTMNFAGTGWLLNFMAAQPNAIVPDY